MFIWPFIYPLQALAFASILELNKVVRNVKEKKPLAFSQGYVCLVALF